MATGLKRACEVEAQNTIKTGGVLQYVVHDETTVGINEPLYLLHVHVFEQFTHARPLHYKLLTHFEVVRKL